MTTPSHVKAPDDTGNAGKWIRTILRMVGGNPVHEHVVVPVDGRDILGVYYSSSLLLTVQQNAHAANVGFIHHINPIGSGVILSIRRMAYQGAPTSTTARPTTLLTAERFTFTGTHSGAVLAAGKADPNKGANVGVFSLNTTGLTATPVGAVQRGFMVPAVPSGNNTTGAAIDIVWEPISQDGETLIYPGQGLMIRQHTAGSAGDDRDFLFNVVWSEHAE